MQKKNIIFDKTINNIYDRIIKLKKIMKKLIL